MRGLALLFEEADPSSSWPRHRVWEVSYGWQCQLNVDLTLGLILSGVGGGLG